MLWKLFQLTLCVGTGCALIYWREHEPLVREPLSNGYVIGLLSIGAAYLGTLAMNGLLKLKDLRPKKSLSESVPRRRTGWISDNALPRNTARQIGSRDRIVDGS